ncbi:MAG TPA: amino acid permease, partial [Clostridia bacterium]|nr:amino acid permease [Clostridia bacterium]
GLGISVVLGFYLMINVVVFAVMPWQHLAASGVPLADACRALLQSLFPRWAPWAGMVMAVGAVLSTLGAEESGTLGTSHLGYAMAVDGYAPSVFARLHPRYGTPYIVLLFQGATALAVALVGTLGSLIEVAVFNMGITYFATCLAVLRLRGKTQTHSRIGAVEKVIPYAGLAAAAYLVWAVGWKGRLMSLGLLALGLPVYLLSPRRQLPDRKNTLLAQSLEMAWTGAYSERFLAHAVKHLVGFVSACRGRGGGRSTSKASQDAS